MTLRSFSLKQYQHLQAGRVGDLLEQFGDAADLGGRPDSRRGSRLDAREPLDDFVVVGGILFLKR